MKKCVVCGAKVTGRRYPANTCDPICTRARDKHRTREEQLKIETDSQEWGNVRVRHKEELDKL